MSPATNFLVIACAFAGLAAVLAAAFWRRTGISPDSTDTCDCGNPAERTTP